MRLLLVKRGSSLPLYLRLVTDHLRLYTLYEQVGWGRKPSLLIFSVLIHFPFFHLAPFTPIPLLFLPSSCAALGWISPMLSLLFLILSHSSSCCPLPSLP